MRILKRIKRLFKKYPNNIVTIRRYISEWELIFSDISSKCHFKITDIKFYSREEAEIYCDLRNLKLVSLSKFNQIYDTNLYGDEC